MGDGDTDLLVALLHEAARLEHGLLDSYLFAACSLKSLPEEFATLPDGRENRRRAIQFERVRSWKQAILEVAHEEMLHLHYVECLIRALGAEPYLGLPPRDPETGNWVFSSWTAHMSGEPAESGGMQVPVEPLTPANIRRFVLYESTDALEDGDPDAQARMEDLFARLHDFELELRIESVLTGIDDGDEREALEARLRDLYLNVAPAELPATGPSPPPFPRPGPPAAPGEVRFQSIADLYSKAILPLYNEAIQFGQVPHANPGLNAELRDQGFAVQGGLLPVLPVHRDKNFDQSSRDDLDDPLRGFRSVEDVIAEIVEEGEGQQGFEDAAKALLDKVAELGGARGYRDALSADAASATPSPPWLDACQRLRLSHLYRFAMTSVELDHEIELARAAGGEFAPARSPLAWAVAPELDELAATLPAQFNAVYLALVMWLSRIYEIDTRDSDRRQRMGIEMLASWPMMSIAIRPFLELASFLPVDPRGLFRLDAASLPDAPLHSRQLLDLFAAPERSQELNDRMDFYALRSLSDVAAWAVEQRTAIAAIDDLDPIIRRSMIGRLDSLATLDEFERQFPYREHGGYADRLPDEAFLLKFPDAEQYEENGSQAELFAESFVLRIRFAGRELIQLATDPDPPTDETGCTGTNMLHAADGDGHWLDRALIWQPDLPETGNVIRREPRDQLPPVGIHATGLDLLVTGGGPARSGYVPIAAMGLAGPLQGQGVQQVAAVSGLEPVETLVADGLRVTLRSKDGRMPFLIGYNHLVWRDGEPIDPFVLAVLGPDGTVVWQREIFNDGKRLMEMSPLQRLYSSRGPCGLDTNLGHIPPWALALLGEQEREQLANPGFPISYLKERAGVLAGALKASLDSPEWSRDAVDRVVSFAERLRLVAVPSGFTVGWLCILLNYGHTVSGAQVAADPALPAGLTTATGLKLQLAPSARSTPNGRWFVDYTQGYMDTDSLSAMVYGELYVPLEVTSAGAPLCFKRSWRFPPGIESVVRAHAVQFGTPFWAGFHVEGNSRTFALPNGTAITETLTGSTDSSYDYAESGFPGTTDSTGSFALASDPEGATLTWTSTFTPADAAAAVAVFSQRATVAAAITAALESHFLPSELS